MPMIFVVLADKILPISLVLMFLFGCTYRNEEEVFAEQICNVGDITYSGFIKPLIEKRCVSCHNAVLPSGNVLLQDYKNLAVVVEDGRFLGATRHDPGFQPMPQGEAKLSNCDILKIEKWIGQGFPEN